MVNRDLWVWVRSLHCVMVCVWFLFARTARRTVGVTARGGLARPADRFRFHRRRIGFQQRGLAFYDGLLLVFLLFDGLRCRRFGYGGRIELSAEINHQA